MGQNNFNFSVRRLYKFATLTSLMMFILLFQNCGSFNAPNNLELNGESPLVNTDVSRARGLSLYSLNCAECHGLADSSSKPGRSAQQISLAIASVNQMNRLSFLTTYDVQAIANALEIGGGDGGGVVTPPQGPAMHQCEANAFAMTPLLKLTNREFRNALSVLLDDFSTSLKNDSSLVTLLNAMPSDTVTIGRNILKEQSKLVTQLGVGSYFDISFRASELVAASSGLNTYPNTNGCLASASVSEACLTSFIRELGSRAFRRPVTSQEAQSLTTALRDTALSKAQQIQTVFTAITQMPDFQYKAFDRGTTVGGANRLLDLTAHELASKVSFFITGFPPDSELRAAADSGDLLNTNVLRAQVDRLLRLPAAQMTIARLFRESYGYNVYDSFNYSPSFLNGISTSNLRQAMNTELDSFFSDLILNQNATFSDLFTSRTANISNADLAQIYGVSQGSAVTLPASRAGFLNRAAMLTKRSGNRASPIKRGLNILEHVLCVEVGPPPPNAPTALPPPPAGQILSTRESTFRTSEAPGSACIGCHTRINNLGYQFESFDTLGRQRAEEVVYDGMGAILAYLPVNTATSTRELSSVAVNTANSVQLSQAIGQSEKAMMCFTKHLKEFESRSEITLTNSPTPEGCHMNASLEALYGRNNQQGTIADAIRSLILSDAFRKWRY